MAAIEVWVSAYGVLHEVVRPEIGELDVHTDGSLVVLHGVLADQAALLGLLERLRRSGLRLRDVELVERTGQPSARTSSLAVARIDVRGRVSDLLHAVLVDACRVEECSTTTLEVDLDDEDAIFEVLADIEGLALDLCALHIRPGRSRTGDTET